jgi:hypothetical protein
VYFVYFVVKTEWGRGRKNEKNRGGWWDRGESDKTKVGLGFWLKI